MTPERFQQVMAIFERACALHGDARSACLEQACGPDAELRREVEALLAHDEGPIEPMKSAAVGGGARMLAAEIARSDAAAASGNSPVVIGRYRVIRKVGEGGMGTVYEAEQENPRRTVALKVIRPGLTSRQLLKRFEQEAQLLGRLQHPGIAQIFDAGTADAGQGPQPFFAMEFIHGRTLTDYARHHALGTRDRLTLMGQVCDAVHHAHQKGIIHRDLKPGNILVVERDGSGASASARPSSAGSFGQVKILDFGVARATDADMQMTTQQTDVGQLIGTIPYMSPEQVVGNPADLDVRSDVYALGVVLYELLAERLPYDIRHKPIAEAARVIGEVDPTPLSSINKVFRGDIETIVAKALEKQKERRYESAADLGADIERYLRDEPIIARPAGTWYQFRKFARRNTGLVGGVAAAFIVLVLGVVGTSISLFRALKAESLAATRLADVTSAKELADLESAKAKQINRFLQKMLSSVNPRAGVGRDVTVKEVLDRAALDLNEELADQPAVRAAIHLTIGDAYRSLGEYAAAETQLRQGNELCEQVYGPDHEETGIAAGNLGMLYWENNNYPAAEPLYRRELEIARRVHGPDDVKVGVALDHLGQLLMAMGRLDESEPLMRDGMRILRAALGEDDPKVATIYNNLARVLAHRGRVPEALEFAQQGLAIRRKVLPPNHPTLASSLFDIALMYKDRGRLEEADPMFAESLAILREALGPDHAHVAATSSFYGRLLTQMGRYQEAEALHRDALRIDRLVFGEVHTYVARSLDGLAECIAARGDAAEGEALYREVLAMRIQTQGDHVNTANAQLALARLLRARDADDEALSLLRDSLRIWRAKQGEGSFRLDGVLVTFAELLMEQEQYDEAEKELRRAIDARRAETSDQDDYVLHWTGLLGRCLTLQGRYADAEPLLLAYYRESVEREGVKKDIIETGRTRLVELYRAMGRESDVARLLNEEAPAATERPIGEPTP